MIVVTVDLDSANGERFNKRLFTMVIINDGTGGDGTNRSRIGNYDVFLGRRTPIGGRNLLHIIRKPLRKGRVEGHPRKSTHVGTLVRRALESVDL